MKKIILFLALISLSTLSVHAVQNKTGAQDGSGAGTGSGGGQQMQQRLMISATPSGVQNQNQGQAQTKNQGEEQQLQMQTQEQERVNTEQATGSGAQQRNQNTEEHMSIVEQKIKALQEIILEGEIGEQVNQIAEEQTVAQELMKQNVAKLTSQNAIKKMIMGTDYTALKGLKGQLDANQLRITQLQELQTQLTNEADVIMVQSTIEALTQQNTTLQERISQEEGTKSMFGWFFRLFVK